MITKLPLNQIKFEGRIREDLGDVEELAESIRDNGLLQPIVVEKVEQKFPSVDEAVAAEAEGNLYCYELRAGGRRYTAFTLLNSNKVPHDKGDFYSEIPVMLLNEMPAHKRVVIELEENIRRKDMTWQEKVEGIVKYHKAQERAAVMDGDNWSQERTGELLNLNQASISIAFTVYKELKGGNERIIKAESLNEALKVIAGDKLDAAQAERMRRITIKRAEQTAVRVQSSEPSGSELPAVSPAIILSAARQAPQTVSDRIQVSLEDIASFYHEGDSLDVLLKLKASGVTINHIICDPPYAISMSNLSGDAISRVEDTHQVAGNLSLLPRFLKVAYQVIAEDGFLCMWYDLDHHEKIAQWASEIGWRVCRWPLTWCKTSPCSNQAAQYNITKATEVCYLFRRSEKSLIKKKQTINYVLAGTAATATHPFCKPEEVWKYLIETVSIEGQTIVDPFAGEGSSLAAIFQSKRNPIGVEIDPKHIASGLSFIQSKLNKKSILDDLLTSSVI